MATKADRKKELWATWASDAIRAYSMPEDMSGADNDDLADDIVDFAEAVADRMLEAYEEAFDSVERPAGRRRRRAKDEEEEEND